MSKMLFLILFLFLIVSCGGGGGNNDPQPDFDAVHDDYDSGNLDKDNDVKESDIIADNENDIAFDDDISTDEQDDAIVSDEDLFDPIRDDSGIIIDPPDDDEVSDITVSDNDVKAICGNGVIEGVERCDLGEKNGLYGSKCNDTCTDSGPRCGDGELQSEHETCDSGVNNGKYGFCKDDCSELGPRCGDTKIDPGFEDCDLGQDNGKYNSGCGADCRGSGLRCGDGVLTIPEVCDDGKENGLYNFCKTDCTGIGLHCGDSVVTSSDETCDAGNLNGLYGSECNKTCSGRAPFCGDGNVDLPHEECDDAASNGMYNMCASNCNGRGPHCGDNIIDYPHEVCDGAEFDCILIDNVNMYGFAECDGFCSAYNNSSCRSYIYNTGVVATNLKKCFNNSSEIICAEKTDAFYGQNGDYPFEDRLLDLETVNGEALVSDGNIGLLWQELQPLTYSGCTGGAPSGSQCSYEEASSYCQNLSYAGISDWRLPTEKELLTLLNYQGSGSYFYSDYFSETSSDYFWSTTASGALKVWAVNNSDGGVLQKNKTDYAFVRCITYESEYSADHPLIEKEINNEKVIIDDYTKLHWITAITSGSWESALSHCRSLTYANGAYWRLPTINELESIVDRSKSDPATDFPSITGGQFWSSTTAVSDITKAWIIDFADGSMSSDTKTISKNIICVK